MIRSCKQCGKEFDSKKKIQDFCSKPCYGESRKKHTECEVCGKSFHNRKIHGKYKKYCSSKCYGISKQGMSSHKKGIPSGIPAWNKGIKWTEMRGENHPNWKGGKTTQNNLDRARFRKTMQKKIFERDNYTCQICEQVGGSLQVDHIKSWAKHPESRFDESNCRTLCMACHYYITFKRTLKPGMVWGHNMCRKELS